MKPSVQDLKEAIYIRRQIDALEKRFAAIILGGSAARSKARRPQRKRRLTPAGRKKSRPVNEGSLGLARRKAARMPIARRRTYEYDHQYGITLYGSPPKQG